MKKTLPKSPAAGMHRMLLEAQQRAETLEGEAILLEDTAAKASAALTEAIVRLQAQVPLSNLQALQAMATAVTELAFFIGQGQSTYTDKEAKREDEAIAEERYEYGQRELERRRRAEAAIIEVKAGRK